MSVGLVLEGGAMRGMYTAGVLDTFLLNNLQVDGIVGVSAGALFGVNYLSKQAGRVIRYNKRFNRDKNYLGLRPLLREGNIVNTKYAYEDVPRVLDVFDDNAFCASGIPFYAVVTEMESGQAEYIRIKSVLAQMDFLRASGSMPFVSKPVEIGGKRYLDGAVTDSIPFEWMSAQGYGKLIVVLTRDADYRKKPMPRVLSSLMYRKYPRFKDQLLQRHSVYNTSIETLINWEKTGQAFVIRPSKKISIRRIEKDPDKLQAVYDLGIKDAERQLESLSEYLR
ncbi:MAG: patatin family protein [Clostridiales bacterium]|nr:patatin family protein [Clostridiales bacterium]